MMPEKKSKIRWLLHAKTNENLMEKKGIIKIGICVTAAFIILVWGLSFLKGDRLLGGSCIYVAEYQKLSGLSEGCPVLLSGYKIGTVESIGFSDQGNVMRIFARLKIGSGFRLPKGTVAKIVSVDIMGTKGVEIERPASASSYLENGDTLAASFEGGIADQLASMLGPAQEHLGSLMKGADSAMLALNQLMRARNIENIESAMESLRQIAGLVSSNSESISSMMQNLRTASEMLGKNAGNIDRAIGNLAQISDTLQALPLGETLRGAQEAVASLNVALEAINKGQGSAAMILNNDTLYRNLESATRKINFLLDDFEKNPKKYVSLSVFGGKDKGKKKNDESKQ